MGHSIKIDGDFTGVKKGILELSKELKKLDKTSDVSLFSKETTALLSEQTLALTKGLEQELAKVSRNADRYLRVIKSTTASQEVQTKALKKHTQMLKEQASIKKQMKDVSDFRGDVNKRPVTRTGKVLGGMSKGMNMPGMGMARNMSGLGLMGGLGMMGGAALGFGAYKGYKGYQQFKRGAGQRLQMKGRGIKDASGINQGLADLGYTPEQVREQQLKGVSTFGKKGSTQGAVLQRAQFERAKGLDKGTMTEVSQGMRGTMGAKGTQEAMYKIQATILANKITDNIGPFLEISSQMLTSMNENGLPADTEVLALMASMTKGGTSEARAMQQIMSANQAVKGSSGDANAFLQTMFAGQGIGGGTVGGSQEAIRMGGLFGLDESKMKDQFGMSGKQIKDYQKLGITGEGTGFEGRTKGMLDFGKENFGTSPQETLRKGEFFKEIFGTQSGGEALGFLNKLEGAQGDTKALAKVEKEIEEASKSPELKVQEDIRRGIFKLAGIDADLEANTGEQAKNMEELGASVSKTGLIAEKALTSIDGGVAAIAKYLTGYESPSEVNRKLRDERKAGFEGSLEAEGLGGGKLGKLDRRQATEEKARIGKDLLNTRQLQKEWKPKVNERTGATTNLSEKRELKEKAEQQATALTAISEYLKDIATTNKATAKNTKKLGGAAKQKTTRGK